MFRPCLLLLVLLFALPVAPAQDAKPKIQLETGHPRELDVVYKTVGRRELELDLYYPAAGPGASSPLIVYTHGGGWAAGSRFGASRGSFAVLIRQLVDEGFCVASVDYRLYNKGGAVFIRDCVTDCKDAVRYLVQNSESLGIDPDQVFAFGDSAGGHLAQMLTLSPPDSFPGDEGLAATTFRPVAGVSWYGPCDFEKVDLFNYDDRPDFNDRFGARIAPDDTAEDEALRLRREVSPINYLDADSPPLLMIQGDQDTTIPVKHAHYIAEVAEERGASVETLIVENSGHNWRKVGADIVPTREEIVSATVRFFVGHLD